MTTLKTYPLPHDEQYKEIIVKRGKPLQVIIVNEQPKLHWLEYDETSDERYVLKMKGFKTGETLELITGNRNTASMGTTGEYSYLNSTVGHGYAKAWFWHMD